MKFFNTCLRFFKKNKSFIFVFFVFLAGVALRLYQIELKTPFGYDQVDNAWAAKDLIVNHKFPLVGMVAKANSGIYIGPLYYYFVAFFYWIFALNPVSSMGVSVISGIFTFWVIYFVIKKLFSTSLAVIAVILNTFSFSILIFDGIQWPVQLLPTISLLIFYFLYKAITDNVKNLMPVAILAGIAFNLHFTAIFFPIIILLSLVFLPRNLRTLKYILIALPLFLVFLIPNIIYFLSNSTAGQLTGNYLFFYYHGFHLQRMIQITGDALIQFDQYLALDSLKPFKLFIFLAFLISFYLKPLKVNKNKFLYLLLLYFMVPWLIFTAYSGEISDYYFIINRFLVLIIFSYFIYLIWSMKFKVARLAVLLLLFAYSYFGISQYLPYKDEGSFVKREERSQKAVDISQRIEFQIGVPESYYYYYLMKTQKETEVY